MASNGNNGKAPPQSIECEPATFPALLLNNKAIPGVMAELRRGDFYREAASSSGQSWSFSKKDRMPIG